jgi:hypothetical protein
VRDIIDTVKPDNIFFLKKSKKKTLCGWNRTAGTEPEHSSRNLGRVYITGRDSEQDKIYSGLFHFLNWNEICRPCWTGHNRIDNLASNNYKKPKGEKVAPTFSVVLRLFLALLSSFIWSWFSIKVWHSWHNLAHK